MQAVQQSLEKNMLSVSRVFTPRFRTQGQHWMYFMRHMVEWGWLHAFSRFGDDCLVVTEQTFIDRLHKQRDAFSCRFTVVDDMGGVPFGDYKNILVFLIKDEQATIVRLKKLYPHAQVFSGTHEFSLVSEERLARLKVLRTPPVPSAEGPIVFISTPNAGAEYFAANMAINNIIQPWEYIGRPFIALAELGADIDFQHLIENTEIRYKKDTGTAYLFQTDVLQALFRHTGLTVDAFIRWLTDVSARVITFHRTDPIQQACETGLLKNTHTRSIWTMRKKPVFTFRFNRADIQNIHDQFFSLQEEEKILAAVAARHSSVMDVVVNDAVVDVKRSLGDIFDHLNLSAPETVEVLDYGNNFWHQSEVQQTIKDVQYALVDRLGLSLQHY